MACFRANRSGVAADSGAGPVDSSSKNSVSLGSAHLEADGIVGRGATLEGRLVADNLSAILPELGGQVDATVRMRGRILVAHFRVMTSRTGPTAQSSCP